MIQIVSCYILLVPSFCVSNCLSLTLSISLHISSIVSPCLLCCPTMKDVGAVTRGVMGMTVDVSVGNMGLVASKRDGTQS